MGRKNKCVAYKKAYYFKDTALRVMKRAYLERGHKLRMYECPICLDIHVTHKNVTDHSIFRQWDKEEIARQNGIFEQLFLKYQNILTPSKSARKRKQKKLNRLNRVYAETVQKPKVKHGFTEQQLPLAEQSRIFDELRQNRLIIQYLFENIDYSQNMWISRFIMN
jgi:hypothetical protein